MKTTKKQAALPKLSEKAMKFIQNVQNLREELNRLTDNFLSSAKKGKFDSALFLELKATANDLKDSARKIKKHLTHSEKTKTKPK